MGKLNKQTFKHFIESECDRRLFLELGEDDYRWLSPLRSITPRPPNNYDHQKQVLELGHDYEEEVYRGLLRASPNEVRRDQSPSGHFNEVALTKERLLQYATSLDSLSRLCLIEHSFGVPPSWACHVFGVSADQALPVQALSSGMRPDLLLMVRAEELRAKQGTLTRVCADGSLQVVPEVNLEQLCALRILDVKNTNEQRIGASHFVELLVYAYVLAAYIEDQGLSDRFFVHIHGHGIFPQLDEQAAWTGLSVAALDDFLVPLDWPNTSHLYARITERMRSLHYASDGRPQARSIESVEVNIKASCGRCTFLEDCKQSLGMNQSDPGRWDVRLLPYTSRSIGQQLHAKGIHTLKDVVDKLPALPLSRTPEPLDAERPLVLLKANSLLQGKTLASQPSFTGGEQHLSVALPRFTDIELVFDVETDPTNQTIFAVGIDLSMRSGQPRPWTSRLDGWWQFWKPILEGKERSPHWKNLLSVLDDKALDLELGNPQHDPENRLGLLRQLGQIFQKVLQSFSSDPQSVFSVRKEPSKGVEVRASWAYVSGDTSPKAELMLLEQVMKRLYELFTICHITELLARSYHSKEVLNKKGEKETLEWTDGPAFAGFYWSAEQMVHVEELLERHVTTLLQSDELRKYLLEIMHWIAPSDSEVSHPLRHKKVYDLRMFVETSLGLPRVINYTWHELLSSEFGEAVSARFWAPHFNYMDFAPWHQMVADSNINTKIPLLQEIQKQIRYKVDATHRLLWQLRKTGDSTFSGGAFYPERTKVMRTPQLPREIHPLGRAWYTYSRLNATTAELAADSFISTYPSFSIGKLAAGRVSALRVTEKEDLKFELRGLSTNVKLKPGDYVFLIPEKMRSQPSSRLLQGWQVRIDDMVWSTQNETYKVIASSGWNKHKLLTGQETDLLGQPWYVFGSSSDQWTPKLHGLMNREHLGTSWLGHRLSMLLEIGPGEKLLQPGRWNFGAPEVYAYAPSVLPEVEYDSAQPLKTTVSPAPDTSQQEAIRFSLSKTFSCLQGPPGTGKSQTIAALIDEYLHRRQGKPTKILVTAFSYSALEVVCEKVVTSKAAGGQPTMAAKQRLLFARSSAHDPIGVVQQHPQIGDLVTSVTKMELDGVALLRAGGKRLEDYAGDSFILFANAHQLYNFSQPSKSASKAYELVHDDFGFDLVIVDEASQLPADYMLASLALIHKKSLQLVCEVPSWPTSSAQGLRSLYAVQNPPLGELTQVVIVGDDQQLPPVQAIKPPEKLKKALNSVFTYYVEGHGIEQRQLQVNYRSLPELVAFTCELGLYRQGINSYFGEHPEGLKRLGPVSEEMTPAWCRQVLAPEFIVGTLVHHRQYDTAVGPLEAQLVAALVEAFFRHLSPRSAEEESAFWQKELGIVSPHNAHGRLLVHSIADRLTKGTTRLSKLSDAELMKALSATIYSVEKFQGSDRTFIIASMGISSVDQLATEEEFIYDRNRFNVLTSRAKQKMLLVCSQNFLDHVPRDREVMRNAAHIRNYALSYCSENSLLQVTNERQQPESVELRWYPSLAPAQLVPLVVQQPGASSAVREVVLGVLTSTDHMLSSAEVGALLPNELRDTWAAGLPEQDPEVLKVGRNEGAGWIGRERAIALLARVLESEQAPDVPESVCRVAGLREDVWPLVEPEMRRLGLWPLRGLVKAPRLPAKIKVLKEEHEHGTIQHRELLIQLFELAAELQKDAQSERRSLALTELFKEIRHPGTPVMVGRIVADIDAIVRVVRLPGWKMTPEAGRELRRALIKTLSKYKLNEEQGLVAKVFAYIEQPTN